MTAENCPAPVKEISPALRALRRRLAARLAPPERVTPSEWILKHRFLSAESSAQSGGRFSFDLFPWQRGIADVFQEPGLQGAVLMMPSQVAGKTEMLNNFVGYRIHSDPSPLLWVSPNVDPMAEAWAKTKFDAMIRATPCLSELISQAKSRSSENTIKFKRFPGGFLIITGANSPAGLASHSIRGVFFDEVDRYGASAGEEGDPISIAMKRMASFSDSFWVMNSTPTVKGFSAIERFYQASDQRKWFCACLKCGAESAFTFANVKWEKDREDEPWFECSHCAERFGDMERREMVRRGQWRATAEFKGTAGFWLHGVNALVPCHRKYSNSLQQFVDEFRQARAGGELSFRVWVNTFCAETYEARDGQPIPAEQLQARAEEYDKLPAEALVVVCGADTQADRIEAEKVAYGVGEKSWAVETKVFHGDPFQSQVWEDFETWLLQPVERADGAKLPTACVFIDRGGVSGGGVKGSHGRHFGEAVDAFTRVRNQRRIFSCFGLTSPGAPLVGRPTRTSFKRTIAYGIGTNSAKTILMARLRMTVIKDGWCHFRKGHGYDLEWYQQLTAEQLQIKYVKGAPRSEWVKTRPRNEALDCRVYAQGALHVLSPDFRALAEAVPKQGEPARVEPQKKEAEERSLTKNAPPNFRPSMPKLGGWDVGWSG